MHEINSKTRPAEKDFWRIDIEKILRASVLFSLLVGVITVLGVYLIQTPGWDRLQRSAWLFFGVSMILWLLLRRGYVRLVTYGMVVGYAGIAAYAAWNGIGVRGTAYAAFPIIVLVAAVFLNRRVGYLVAGLASCFGLALVFAYQTGLLVNADIPLGEIAVWANISLYIFAAAGILDIVLQHVERALQKQNHAEEELRLLNTELERRIAERTAQWIESETHYRLIAENASDVIWTMDLNMHLTYISPSAERATGYTVEEMMIHPISETLTPDSYTYAMRIFNEEMSNQSGRNDPAYFRTVELEYLRKDRSTYWSEVKVSLLRDEMGQPIGIIGVGRNINQRRQTEIALRESEERYRLVSTVSSDYVFSNHIGVDGHIVSDWISGAFEAITGYSVEEFNQRGGWTTILHPEDTERDAQDIARLYANQRVITEIRILHKSGVPRWVRIYAHPIWDTQNNTLRGIYGAVQDITEQKRADIQARQRREMLEKVIELGQAVTRYTDLQTCLQQIHHSVKHELGFDRVGLLLYDPENNQLQDTLVPNHLSEIDDSSWYLRAVNEHESWNAVMKTPKGLTIIEEIPQAQSSKPDEKTRPMKQHATLAAWAGDKPVALIAVDNALTRHPMTEEKLEALKLFAGYAGLAIENARWNAYLERRVAERTAELEAANRELQDFSYTIAHDLRAPARAMIGFSRLLQEDYAGELSLNGQHYLNRVNHGARRMGQMIDELLEFTRLGRQTLRKETVNMPGLVRQILDEFAPETAKRHVEVSMDSLPDVYADPEMMEMVWHHLLANAFKFTRQVTHPEIKIGAIQKKGEIQYSIYDNGVGFDMQYAAKLFGVFHRLHLEEEYEGTGMGLAIVHRIITRHGGRIWVEAEPAKGATFYFSLP